MNRIYNRFRIWTWEWMDYIEAISNAIHQTHVGHIFEPPQRKKDN